MGGGPSSTGGSARLNFKFTVNQETLPEIQFLAIVLSMSSVELAVRKVKRLSHRQARELLGWLAARETNGASSKQSSRVPRRKATARRSMQGLKAWQESVRGMTNWEPPRMPDDSLKSFPL